MSDHKPAAIIVTPRGPYIASGFSRIINVTGKKVSSNAETTLCRCGYSKNKPFCDGAHGPYQFGKERQTGTVTSAAKIYRGQVQVHYNASVCAHLGVCTRELPEVFDTTRRPWILPDNADAIRIIDVVNRCPSGALTFTSGPDDVPADTGDNRQPTIRALKNGPLAVEGTVELENINWVEGASQDRFTLCRCGSSRTMPFCDGSHSAVGFADE